MAKQRLRDTLQTLHQELAGQTDLDAKTAEALLVIMADITRLLDGNTTESGDSPDPQITGQGSLAQRLSSATGDFEASHPKLTTAVTQLAEALSAMGI
jgi:hypothetical protein